MGTANFKPQDLIEIITSFKFKVIPEKEKYRPGAIYYEASFEYWKNDENEDFWNFEVQINGYNVKNIADSWESIQYESYLEDYLEKYQNYYLFPAETPLSKGQEIDLIQQRSKLNRTLNQFKKVDVHDDKYGGLFHKILINQKVEIQTDQPNKIDQDCMFFKTCIAKFLEQQKNIIKYTIEFQDSILNSEVDKGSKYSLHENNITQELEISWNKSDTNLLELIIALIESGSIQNATKNLTNKEAIEIFSKIFNKKIKDPYKKLNAARARKKDDQPFLLNLQSSLDDYFRKQEEKDK